MLYIILFFIFIFILWYRRRILKSGAHHHHHHHHREGDIENEKIYGHYPSINYKHYNVVKLDIPLSNGPFNFVDIKQGDIGSCWYLSALAAYLRPDDRLQVHQKKLSSRIVKINDDLYKVEFRGMEFIIDTYVPKHYIACSIEKTVLWPILFEKAMISYETGKYEKLHGGYCCRNLNISAGENNYGALGLELVTGHCVSYGILHKELSYYIDNVDKQKFEEIWNRGEYILANTNTNTFQHHSKPVQQINAVKNHCYAILNVYKKDDELYLTLYNPWSTKGMTNQNCSLDHGEFNISWKIFFKTFACIHYTTNYIN
jgi:hypothetical protein